VLEIQLPAIYRARSTAPIGEDDSQVDDGSGLPEDHVLRASAGRLRTVPAATLPTEDVVPDASPVSIEEDVVSIHELLVWEPIEEKGPIDTRVGRLASLLGIAAVVIAALILVFAAGTDVASVFRSGPGS
jgi:hypothetical protein